MDRKFLQMQLRELLRSQKSTRDLMVLYVIPPNLRNDEIFDLGLVNGQKIVDEVKQEATAKKLNIHTQVLSDESSVTKAIVEYAEKMM
jgi:hypothetical protein